MREVGKREAYEWFLFIFPFFVFGETPRYILPALATMTLHLSPRPALYVSRRATTAPGPSRSRSTTRTMPSPRMREGSGGKR